MEAFRAISSSPGDAMTEVQLSADGFLAEADRIVRTADARGIALRICGSVGIFRSVRDDPLAVRLYGLRNGTSPSKIAFKDLDLAALERDASRVYRLFVREMQFQEDRETNALFGSFRNIYYHPQFQIDVFFDVLRFNHAIPIKDRLVGGVTLPLEDIFLGKVQIHSPPRKDFLDLAAFAAAVPFSRLDRGYLEDFFGNDWGLWYDADMNLKATRTTIEALRSGGEISEADAKSVLGRLDEYRTFLETCPKSRRWERRAAKGTKDLWYEPVDEVR